MNRFIAACCRVCFQLMQIFFITIYYNVDFSFSYCPCIFSLSPTLLIYISDPCQAHIHILDVFPYFLFLFILFALIISFACSCSDMSKTKCSWQLCPSLTWCSCFFWSAWSHFIQTGFSFLDSGFTFFQWLYFPVEFDCVLIIFPLPSQLGL